MKRLCTTKDSSVAAQLRLWADRNERVLDALLPATDCIPERLHQAMRYASLGGGKRIRPCLVYATGMACGADPERLNHAAAAVEMIHAYSLIHDDLPAMDNDAMRRGKPTVHIAFGEATAILAGDALQALAFSALAQSNWPAERLVQGLRLLADAAGATGMAGGQAIDLDAVGQTLELDALEQMHRRKTGALIRAAVALGAIGAEAPSQVIDKLNRFADALGLAFQIRDDLLDVEASSEDLGKTSGKDAAHNKPTYVSLLGVDGSRARLQEQVERMGIELARLGLESSRIAALEALARLAVERKH